jgi:hypothetical protein
LYTNIPGEHAAFIFGVEVQMFRGDILYRSRPLIRPGNTGRLTCQAMEGEAKMDPCPGQ